LDLLKEVNNMTELTKGQINEKMAIEIMGWHKSPWMAPSFMPGTNYG
jgi:hypothetical protein